MLIPIQTLVLPNTSFGAPEEMYVRRNNNGVFASLSKGNIQFFPGGYISFDTYFNGLTVHSWKQNCTIDDLSLTLKGTGQFLLRFCLHRTGHSEKILSEHEITLSNGQPLRIDIPEWSSLQAGILFFSLHALTDGSVEGGFFGTTTFPPNDVKLGIVITHFDRKKYVLPAIERIKEQLLDNSEHARNIELCVVDNSQNITKEEATGITLIKNRNLGGSGGFTRGLLHLKDEGSFTHCLFMDDDASCEIESIRRAYALLCYANRPKTAVAGSLLRELEPYRLFEKGAQFDGLCRPLKCGLDMRHIPDLLESEQVDAHPHYGGWWFFAFNISDAAHLAFPFFVRGDDIMFSMMNKFNIVTQNGINCWGDDFALKSGPLPIYLDLRNHLMQKITHMNSSKLSCLLLAARFFAVSAFSYNYSTAKAVTKSVRDFCQGEEFWRNNLDTHEIRKEIGNYAVTEKLHPITRADYSAITVPHTESLLRKLIRILTLNGFLIPHAFLIDKTVHQQKGFRGVFREIFRYKRVLYEYEPTGVGYIAEHDKRRLASESIDFIRALSLLSKKFDILKKEYQYSLTTLTSEAFWREVYSLPHEQAKEPQSKQ